MLKELELSAPQAAAISSRAKFNLFQGGQGVGKTQLMGVIAALFVRHVPDALGIIAANTYGQLSESTLLRIFLVWRDHFGWSEWSKENSSGQYVIDKEPPTSFKPHGFVFKDNHNKIFFRNGSVVMLASLDNYKSLDGREVGWALLDETKDTREEALMEVILGRVRAIGLTIRKDFNKDQHLFPFVPPTHEKAGKAINPIYIFTSPAKEQWLSELFKLEENRIEIESRIFSKTDYYHNEDLEQNQAVTIASTYHNSKNLNPNHVEDMLRRFSVERAAMLVYGSPFGKTGAEYYSSFNDTRHIKPCRYEPNTPIKIAFDFNVNPYMTLIVSQIVRVDNRWKWRFLNEYCLESPHNTIHAVVKAFRNEYGHLCSSGLDFYGDASGKNTLPLENMRNYYQKIEELLFDLIDPRSRKLLRKNPNHRSVGTKTLGRRDLMNDLLAGVMGVDIEIDPKCRELIADFRFCKEDPNGAKLKETTTVNKVTFQPRGHASDAADSIGSYEFGDYARD